MNPMTLFDLITYQNIRENPPNIWWNHFFIVLLSQKQIKERENNYAVNGKY